MKKIVNVRKALKSLTMALALSMALSGCSFGDKTNMKTNESSYEIQTDDIIEETQEHTHDHEIEKEDNNINQKDDQEREIPKEIEEEANRKGIVKDDVTNKSTSDKEEKTSDSVVVQQSTNAMYDEMGRLIVPDLSLQFNNKEYTQNSIIKALKLAGFNSSYEYRALLAEHFGIEKYRGTAEQNLLLLHYLRHPELFLGQNDISHSDDNQITQDNGVTQNNGVDNNQGIQNNGNGNGNENNGGNGNGSGSGNGGGNHEEDKDQGRWVVTNTIYKDIPNDDVNHLVIREERNTKTGQTRTTSTTEAHNYADGKCRNCSHTKKQEDTHNLTGAISKTYTDKDDTNHTVVERQYCSTHNTYEIIKTYEEAHTPGEWKVNPDNPNEEIQVCTKGGCGHIIARRPVVSDEHNYTGNVRKEYAEKDGSVHTVTEYQYCTTHGKEEVKRTYDEAHVPGDWEDDPLDPTKEIKVCKHCGEIVETRDKQVEECKHQNTEVRVTYEYTNDGGHVKIETTWCNDCKEVVGTPIRTNESHTPIDAGTTTVVAGKGDENGHYVVTTYTCAVCKHTYNSAETYVPHENESYTQVGVTYTPATNEAGEEGHTVVYTYEYDKCGVQFTSTPVFEKCTNVDNECPHCHRPITPEHTHNEDGTRRIVRTGDETGFCYKVVHYCTEHPDDESAQRVDTITEHKEIGRTNPDNDREVDIYCSECNLFIRTIRKSELGDIPMQDASNSIVSESASVSTSTEENAAASTGDVQSISTDGEGKTLTTDSEGNVIIVETADEENQEENLENSEKNIENDESKLYNEYIEIVDEYMKALDSDEDEKELDSEKQNEEQNLGDGDVEKKPEEKVNELTLS